MEFLGKFSDTGLGKFSQSSRGQATGGAGGGVQSLNSLVGHLSLISSDSSITVNPSGANIDLSANSPDAINTPTINILSGATEATIDTNDGGYFSSKLISPGAIIYMIIATVISDSSGGLVNLQIPGLVTENFNDPKQAKKISGDVINAAYFGQGGGIANGIIHQIYADVIDGGVLMQIETAQANTAYIVHACWISFLQPAGLQKDRKIITRKNCPTSLELKQIKK